MVLAPIVAYIYWVQYTAEVFGLLPVNQSSAKVRFVGSSSEKEASRSGLIRRGSLGNPSALSGGNDRAQNPNFKSVRNRLVVRNKRTPSAAIRSMRGVAIVGWP